MRLAMIAAGLVLAMGCGRGVAAERTQIKLDGLFEAIAAKPAWLRGPAYAKTLSDAARRGTTNGAAYALCSESAWAPTVALLDREVAGEVGAFDAGVVASAKCDGVRRLAATFAVRSANDLRIQGHHEAAALRWKTACALGSEIACETPATESPAMLAWTQAPKPRPASVRPQVMVSLRAGGIVVDGRPLKRGALTAEVSSLADAALALRPELETPVVLEADASVSMGVLSDAALALLSTGLSQVDVQVLAPDGTHGRIPAVALVRSHRVKRPRTGPMAEATLGGIHLGMMEKDIVARFGLPDDPAPSGPANLTPCETKVFMKAGVAVSLCEGSSTPDARVVSVTTLAMVAPIVTDKGVGTKATADAVRAAYTAYRSPLNPRDYQSNVALRFKVDPDTQEVIEVFLGPAY